MAENSETVENLLKTLTTIFGRVAGASAGASSTGTDIVTLPSYSPKDSDLEEWIASVDNVVLTMKWTEQEAAVRAASALKDSARTWYENWRPVSVTWTGMKTSLLSAFPKRRNFGHKFNEAANLVSNHCKTYEEYIREKHEKLLRLRLNLTDEQIVDIIIFGISDLTLRTTISHLNCKTIVELSNALINHKIERQNLEIVRPEKRRRIEDDNFTNKLNVINAINTDISVVIALITVKLKIIRLLHSNQTVNINISRVLVGRDLIKQLLLLT